MSPNRPTPDRNRPSGPGALAALLFFALLSVVMTWPLVLHLDDHVPLGNNDLWQNYWNFWWWQEAIFGRGISPLSTDLIYQPGEVSLALHTHSFANTISMLPVSRWWSVAAALNVATLLGFVLSGWGMYFLARELSGCRGSAILAGIPVAFSAQHFEQALEHINLASYQAMPFFLFFLVRLLRYGGCGNAAGAGLFFALNALYSWHNGLLIVPGAALLVAHGLWTRRCERRRILLGTMGAGFVAALVTLPFAWPMLTEMVGGSEYIKSGVPKGVDLVFLVIPPGGHPFWGGAVAGAYESLRSYQSVGFVCYLGIVTLVLAALALRPLRGNPLGLPSPWPWAAMAGGYLLLALGHPLLFAGQAYDVPTPFQAFRSLPIFGALRVANRFVVPATLALGVLAACGAARWLRSSPRPVLWTLVLTVLLIVDSLWLPFPLRQIPAPNWVSQLDRLPAGTILNVPGGHRPRASEDMLFQTQHGRKMVGGYTSVIPEFMERRVSEYPFLHYIFEGIPKVDPDVPMELRRVLTDLDVTLVVVHAKRTHERLRRLRAEHAGTAEARKYNVHRGMPAARLDEIRAALREQWGEPAYRDEDVAVWARP